MIDRDTAIQLAQGWLNIMSKSWGITSDVLVDEKNILEVSFAWILPWNDRAYLLGEIPIGRVGHSEVVVLKSNGSIMELLRLTPSEYVKWKSKRLHGSIEDRIANLAEKLGVTMANG